ncbi:MAG TPA: hypothetical protein VFE30_10530 [Anaeromyxobacteraceae bacterium]|jgi:hypothetical protein|nr:hypothetical protein [Anaeromyxobacteraceae bacterium]
MSDSQVRIRALQLKLNLATIDDLGAEVAGGVRGLIRAATVEQIERADGLAWLPVELDVEIARAVQTCLGTGEAKRWAAAALRRTIASPLLAPLRAVAVEVFRVTPGNFLKFATRGWALLFLNAGELELATLEPSGARLVLRPLAPELRSMPYLISLCGALQAVIEEAGATATSNVEVAPAGDHAVFTFSWRRQD